MMIPDNGLLFWATLYVQPLVTGWSFRDIGSARTAVGHSLSPVRRPSTLCPMSCATPPSTHQLSDDFKDIFSRAIYTFSALEVKT